MDNSKEFLNAQVMIYLDYSSATPVDEDVLDVFIEATRNVWGNAFAQHSIGQKAHVALYHAKKSIADYLQCHPKEIICTGSASESNLLALSTFTKPGSILTSCIEHDSILDGIKDTNRLAYFSVNQQGLAEIPVILAAITDTTEVISLMLANNEIGTIQQVQNLSIALRQLNNERSQQRKPPIFLHTDATQTPNFLNLDVQKLGIDYLTLSGQKVYAPKGTALLYAKSGAPLPLQAHTPTPNVPGILALAAALQKCQETREIESRRLAGLRNQLATGLQQKIPSLIINGYWGKNNAPEILQRLPHNLHITIPTLSQDFLLTFIDLHGLIATSGSACRSGASVVSPTLKSIGAQSGAHLRLTLGRPTTEQEIQQAIQIIHEAFKTTRS